METALAKLLTTALVQFIDRERPEGTMCCSSYECEKIEKAFECGTYDIVENILKRKLSRLTEFEQALSNYLKNDFEYFHTQKWDEQKWNDVIRTQSKELLALAKKELLSYADENNSKIEAMADLERTYSCNPEKLPLWLKNEIARRELDAHTRGYNKGYKDAEKQYNESVAYHYPTMPQRPLCWEPGGTCTNPHMDCINCPRKTTGGGFNTNSGTSTLKAEG